ncbi:MAG: ATP-binding protein [Candidatus Omnitrophota bacterium]
MNIFECVILLVLVFVLSLQQVTPVSVCRYDLLRPAASRGIAHLLTDDFDILDDESIRTMAVLLSFGHSTDRDTDFTTRIDWLKYYLSEFKEAVELKGYSFLKLAEIKASIEEILHNLQVFGYLYQFALEAMQKGSFEKEMVLEYNKKIQENFLDLSNYYDIFCDQYKDIISESMAQESDAANFFNDCCLEFGNVLKILEDRVLLLKSEVSNRSFNICELFNDNKYLAHFPITDHSREAERRVKIIMRDKNMVVRGNEKSINSTLLNLIVNAIKYGGDEIVVNLKTEGNYAIFSVEDNGEGIPEVAFEKIHSPFYTTDGTGVGLTVSRFIVKDHGGEFKVETIPLKGTVQ